MTVLKEPAWGKLNLTLDILGLRQDGYHEMSMIMQSVDLHDAVTVTLDSRGSWSCLCEGLTLEPGKKNLALLAAEKYFDTLGTKPDGCSIFIEKQIPVQGGMAGGSSDAAAVLRALQRHYGSPLPETQLYQLAGEIGSDVPYCLMGGTALAKGRGEILQPLPPMPPCAYVLLKPDFSVSTPELFSAFDHAKTPLRPNTDLAIKGLRQGDLSMVCRGMGNVFQPLLEARFPVIGELCRSLLNAGAVGASLTGTGSVVYGVFAEDVAAHKAVFEFQQKGIKAFFAKNV